MENNNEILIGFTPVSRKVWQPIWSYIMDVEVKKGYPLSAGDFPFENDVFKIEPFDYDAEYDQVNFFHKPSGYKMTWYKYPLRSADANMEITPEQFVDILYDCTNSLDRRFTHEIEPWWEKK